jgi:hypothetical protein
MSNRVTIINEEYFGEDRSKTYLKDDFSAVLRAVVQRGVILDVFLEASRARHNKEELEDGGTAFGDFDPDNAGFLSSIFETYQKGLMVDVRQLLTPKETGTGGKFIKDIQKLNVDDFVDFYKNSKPDSTNIPPLLLVDFMNARSKDKSIKGADFIDSNRTKIEQAVKDLVAKAKQLQSKGYFNKIVRDYQALEFHKDNRPEKYDTREGATDFPFMNGKMTIRSRKSKVEIKSIDECLNDFAEIVMIYQSLVSKNTNFLGSNWPLDTYIERTFALFSKEIPDSTKKKAAQDIVKYLHKSIDIVGWDHRKILKNKSKKA